MKPTGIITRCDKIGRMLLPKQLVKDLNIKSQTAMEIYIEDDTIVLEAYLPKCVLCGETENLKVFKGQNLCAQCIEDLSRQ